MLMVVRGTYVLEAHQHPLPLRQLSLAAKVFQIMLVGKTPISAT